MKTRMTLSVAAILAACAVFWGMGAPTLLAGQSVQAAASGRSAQENANLNPSLAVSAAAAENPAVPGQQRPEAARPEAKPAADDIVVKTYSLRYIGWRDVANAARFYVVEATGSDNTLTVMIRKKDIPDFEAVLRKLDVEKKNIMFRVYTVIAAKDGAPDLIKKPQTKNIENKDLKVALDEIKGLWNFKLYWVDAPSFLTVKDGSGGSHVRLVSSLLDDADFGMFMGHVRLTGDEIGKRNITVGELKLDLTVNAPNASHNATLIETQDISVKEKGYLIVGVSGLESAWSGLALILVISAEVK